MHKFFKFIAVALVLALLGCDQSHVNPTKPTNIEQLQEKYRTEKAKAVSDFTAELYPNPQDCDWTLWAGKAAAVGLPISPALVESAPGYLHRRPLDQGECYPDHSNSTISNDMITGYVGALWREKDGDGIQRVARFAVDHGGFMGAPQSAVGEVYLKPPLAILIAKMQNKLQNEDTLGMSGWVPDYSPVTDDYAQHIQALQIAYYGEVNGSITDQMRTRLNGLPSDNFTFASILGVYTGNFDPAYSLLLADSPKCSSYVRGERPDIYCRIEWLWAADYLLRN